MFVITVDHQADANAKPGTNLNAVGMVGPRGATLNADEIKSHPKAQAFRMKDDDGELYYEGFYLPSRTVTGEGANAKTLEHSDELQPLDCFGTPHAGATTIEYKNAGGVWEAIN